MRQLPCCRPYGHQVARMRLGVHEAERRSEMPMTGGCRCHQCVPDGGPAEQSSGRLPGIASLSESTARFIATVVAPPALLAGDHCGGFPLQVDVDVAAHVDGDSAQRSTGEQVRRVTGVVVGDRFAAVPADAEAFSGDGELAGLGLDLRFADLPVAVPEAEGAGSYS